MPKEIARLADNFQTEPKRIEVARQSQTADTIKQFVMMLPRGDDKAKRTALRRAIEGRDIKNGIVFCNRKSEVNIVAASLTKHGFQAEPIHGDLPQSARMETLQKFRDGDLKLLVASDVAARGLDVPDVSHVFNYSPPPKDEDYVHRIGRTGRAGRSGESLTLVGPEDQKGWRGVLQLIKTDVESMMPDGLLEELQDLPTDSGGRRQRGNQRSGDRKPSRDRPDRKGKAGTEKPAKIQNTERSDHADGKDRGSRPERNERPQRKRDYKRPDDDLHLDPAADNVVGFGDDVPNFLK